VEQIIRPTGLMDPVIEVKPAKHQVDDLLAEIRERVEKNERVLVTTLTKRMAENLTDYYAVWMSECAIFIPILRLWSVSRLSAICVWENLMFLSG